MRTVPNFLLNRVFNFNEKWLKSNIHSEALLGKPFLTGLVQLLWQTRKVPGDIIELGTYKGGSTIIMALFLKQIGLNKHIFACDTFKGHPYDDLPVHPHKHRKGDYSDTSIQYVSQKFLKYGVINSITIVEGLFEETLPKKLSNQQFSFAFIDCDLYKSTKFCLNFLIPRIAPNGIIALHDYGNVRASLTLAVHEQCAKQNLKVKLAPVPHIQF